MGRLAPFTYDAWHSPELVKAVSQVAGVDLVPSMDFEVANINIAVNNQSAPAAAPAPTLEGKDAPLGDGLSSVAWHYDSFPFVCVVMLSDCTDMVGGETALKTPSGEIMKVRGPAMVSRSFSSLSIQLSCSSALTLLFFRAPPSSFRAGTSSTRPSRPSAPASASAW